jgi:Uma2 family endonuclease
MILQTEKKYYTPEEYLTLEEKATDKHEYRDGEIVIMPGGTTNHNQIGSSGLGMVRYGGINRLNPYLARDLID